MHSSICFSLFIDKSLWTQICEIVKQCCDQLKWTAHHLVSRIPNPILWSLCDESDHFYLKKKRETKMKWVKFFWFVRKLSKIPFTVLRICENMGGHILYQKSFCHLQIANRKFINREAKLRTGQTSGSQHSVTNFHFQDFQFFSTNQMVLKRKTIKWTIFFWFTRKLAKIHYIFGIENSMGGQSHILYQWPLFSPTCILCAENS